MRWLLLLALLLYPLQAGATTLFIGGAETGDTSELTSVSGSVSATTNTVKHGAYVYRIQSPTANSTFSLPGISGSSATTIYIRFWHWIGATNDNCVLVIHETGGTELIFGYIGASGKYYFKVAHDCNTASPVATSTNGPGQSTYNLVELKAVISSSVGGLQLKLNGTTEFTSFGSNTGTGTIDNIKAFLNNNSQDMRYDSIIVGTDGFFGDGTNIARQGTSGSPSFTAWTKNSCTSSLIENCWSTTPFGTAANASSAVAADAQTMFVHDFATTQTGHGTETLGGGSTINACKTAMIAKSGTSSAPLSIRRILNGATTDTAKTLTTSDAYYDDGIWTTTANVLRNATAMEIGAVHGTGTATDTVEDMWLICDYVDATGTPVRHRIRQDGN